MRVALVAPEFRTGVGGTGGVAAVSEFLVRVIEDQGWEVQAFSPRMSRSAPESRRLLAPQTWFRPIRLHRKGTTTTIGAHIAEFEPVRYLPRRSLDEELKKWDVIVLVAGSPALAVMLRRLNRPALLQVATMVEVERAQSLSRASGTRRPILRLTTSILARLDVVGLRYPTAIAVENEWMKSKVRSLTNRRVELCPPGVDVEVFTPNRTGYNEAGNLLMVARLDDVRKDYPTLFRSFAIARDSGMRASLILAGRGELLPADLQVLHESGVAEHVMIKKGLEREELIREFQRAALFVSSSREEGLGISSIEALACGLPVISTATEGAQYVLGSHAAGELVPVGDPWALGSAMSTWMADDSRRQHAAVHARRLALERFSSTACGNRFAALIRWTAGQNSAA